MKCFHRLQITNDQIFEKPRCRWTWTRIIMPKTNTCQESQWSNQHNNSVHLSMIMDKDKMFYFGTDITKASIPPRCNIIRSGSANVRILDVSWSPYKTKWTYNSSPSFIFYIWWGKELLWILFPNVFDDQWKAEFDNNIDLMDDYQVKVSLLTSPDLFDLWNVHKSTTQYTLSIHKWQWDRWFCFG